MSVIDLILAGFRELIGVRSFNKITISDICRNAGVTRKTFYAYFEGKDDVINKIVQIDIVVPIEEICRLLRAEKIKSAPRLITEVLYQVIYDNRAFYENLLTNGGLEIFVNAITDEIFKLNKRLLSPHCKLPAQEQDYMAYFYASSQAMLLIKWIEDKMTIPPQRLAEYYMKWTLQNWVINAMDKRASQFEEKI